MQGSPGRPCAVISIWGRPGVPRHGHDPPHVFLAYHNSDTVLPGEDADLPTDAIMAVLDDPAQADTGPSLQNFEPAKVVDNYERKLK